MSTLPTDSSPTLGRVLTQFAVVSDSHVNPSDDRCNSPFPVNRRANRRFRYAIRQLNTLPIEFVIHLGDLVHPVPESGAAYAEAADAYRRIVDELTVPIHVLPGNHDIGDTPIDGAPAHPTTAASIAAWAAEFGAQYQAFSAHGLRFLLINAQLVNSGLPDEAEQAAWLDRELEQAAGQRVMLFLHHPPYLMRPDEDAHYDNTNPPGRAWLLDRLARHKVEAVFAGHAHNFWYNRYCDTDYYLSPATSFVRQDYSEMLRQPPPEDSEFGRDDKAKLGYFLVTLYEHGHTVQMIRTDGAEAADDVKAVAPVALAPHPKSNPSPLIGFDLRQNWAEITEVPPSGGLDEFDRKLVRNDYPLLALLEMGVRDLRVPIRDLLDPDRADRLAALVHLGFRLTLFSFGVPEARLLETVQARAGLLRDWELTLNASEIATAGGALAHLHQATGLPILLSRMRSKDDLQGGQTYFHVINHGFSPKDRPALQDVARLRDHGVTGAVFRLGQAEPPGATLAAIDELAVELGIKASVHLRLAGENPAENQESDGRARVVEVMETVSGLSNTRVFCDTLSDVDRGYFPRKGVIDRAGNPRPLLADIAAVHRRNLDR